MGLDGKVCSGIIDTEGGIVMGKRVRSHRDLVVWQRGIEFAVWVYRATDGFPKQEVYGLTDQIRRAAVSIPANIAEGQGRRTDGAFAHYLDIALGSAAELDTHLQIALQLNYLSKQEHQDLLAELTEITKMLHGLYRTVSKHIPNRQRPTSKA